MLDETLVMNGKLGQKNIDDASRMMLSVKFAAGSFEDPRPETVNSRIALHPPGGVRLAKRRADESTVLLENKGNILPLDIKKLSSVAVIGPNADQVQFGDYTCSDSNDDGITPLRGIRELVGRKIEVNYAKGCDPYSQDNSGFAEAVRVARDSDMAIVFVGSQSALLARSSMPSTSGEGYDLSSLKLPGVQEELIHEIAGTGKPVVVVLVTGKPFDMGSIRDAADALLVQWYAGERAGESIADILFGKVNPSGRLPVSFPKSVGHLPAYYDYYPSDKGYYNKKGGINNPGRDYVFSDPYALYPFGYGRSYTEFEYSDVGLSTAVAGPADTVYVTVTVRNAGMRDGSEVVQVYVRDLISSVMTPVKRLHGFCKVHIPKGKSRTVTIPLPVDRLAVYNEHMEHVVEPGEFEVQVGSSSADIRLAAKFTVPGGDADMYPSAMRGEEPAGEPGPPVTVSGTVRDVQASVMSGVSVTSSVDPDITVKTDAEGRFRIATRVNDVLVISSPGYSSKKIVVRSTRTGDVTLIPHTE